MRSVAAEREQAGAGAGPARAAGAGERGAGGAGAHGAGAGGARGAQAEADDLARFLFESPTSFHAVAAARARLQAAGFRELREEEAWTVKPGARRYVVRGGGSLIALVRGARPEAEAGFRMVAAHTDSPHLRLKPRAAARRHGFLVAGVEVYGSPILASWTDRDLGLAGRVSVRAPGGTAERLVHVARPVARVPLLAIHLDRKVNDDGLKLDRQQHLPPLVGLCGEDRDPAEALAAIVAEAAGAGAGDLLAWDLALCDTQPPAFGGPAGELVLSGRLDNLASCHAAIRALIATADEPAPCTRVAALFDHEEVGSVSARGAESSLLPDVVERVAGAQRADLVRALARSLLVSADMAHALHPNHADKHDPEHAVRLGGGPAIKVHASQRYATDAEGAARFRLLCERAEVPCQTFVSRSDLPCGTTVGPLLAARLGVRTVDAGAPMLAMHSIRETAAVSDHARMVAALRELYRSAAG